MKNIILSILILIGRFVFACDFCGCSPNISSNDAVGLEMQSNVGVSSNLRKFIFKDATENIKSSWIFTNTIQGAYAPKNWVDIRVAIPIIWIKNNYTQSNQNYSDAKTAIGDVQIQSNFMVWQKKANDSNMLSQKLNFGFGLELPTGKRLNANNDILQNINFGSQSLDFLFNGLYAISKNNWNFMHLAQIKINTYNHDKFKFGNYYSYQFITNYVAYVQKSNLIPSFSPKIEIVSKNLHNNIIQSKSGFWLLSLNLGLEWTKKNYHLGFLIQQPIAQNTSKKLITQNTLTNIYFKYQFKTKSK